MWFLLKCSSFFLLFCLSIGECYRLKEDDLIDMKQDQRIIAETEILIHILRRCLCTVGRNKRLSNE